MSAFKPLYTRGYKKVKEHNKIQNEYWKNLKPPKFIVDSPTIDYVDFSPSQPHYFAVTSSVHVRLYSPLTSLVVKNFARFRQNAYGGKFRDDGKLLIAGDDEGLVKLFDIQSKNLLRLFRGHDDAVHRAAFIPNTTQIVSFSDDNTVKIWDIASESVLHRFKEHTDYIRAGCVNPSCANVIISGGYDSLVQMYDTRTNKSTLTMNHESPVESVLFLPTGGIFLTAGGTEIRIWDVLAGGKLLGRLSPHRNTITNLQISKNGTKIFSSSLDRSLKVFDVGTYSCIHKFNFSYPILGFGVSADDQVLAVGMAGGSVAIQKLIDSRKEKIENKIISTTKIKCAKVVPEYVRPTEAKYDLHLRKYEYTKALLVVLNPYVRNKSPHIVVSVLNELIQRKGLHRALCHQTHTTIGTLVLFIIKNISKRQFTSSLIDIANILLDLYQDKFDQFHGEIGILFVKLKDTLKREIKYTFELAQLQGAIELLLAGTGSKYDISKVISYTTEEQNTKQSKEAQFVPEIMLEV